MRKLFFILFCSAISLWAKADHITGGEMFYTYLGFSNGMNNYAVTLKLFMRCNSGRQFPNPAIISVFDKKTLARFRDISVNISNRQTLNLTNNDPCISNPPAVCYEVAFYNFQVSLPPNEVGYTLASEVNYRIRGITNLFPSQVGATYTCEIPGNVPLREAPGNNSASFTGSDLVVVCANNFFSYSFAAADADGDQLSYIFCSAYASTNTGINGVPAGTPPYLSVSYNTPGFFGTMPLGNKVELNPATGLISGIAPAQGIYVVTVCVQEIRDGVVIATQRKDLQINIADCSVAAASLNEEYMLCGNTRSISISNQSTSPLITSYDWEILSPTGALVYTTKNAVLDYTFPGNGVYTVRLSVNKGQPCSDVTSAKVLAFPGLVPDFTFAGICINKATSFLDKTTVLSGNVNSWTWDFGEPGDAADNSILQNPAYDYAGQGIKTARLIVTTTDGCRDTVLKDLAIVDKPPIHLAFRDTLICKNDRLQLQAEGTGNFMWSPAVDMTGANSASPSVNPANTTTYFVDLENETCTNRDSVKVRVVDHVNLQTMNDTTICSRDTILLQINSDGLRYAWTPAAQLINATVKTPLAITSTATVYQVTASIGGCAAIDYINVGAVPYPLADAGKDTTICYNTSASLQGLTNGDSWSWHTDPSLSNASLLNPVVHPAHTINYILMAYDSRGCPKPGYDTVEVKVLPLIVANAGRDTSVVIGQPLQLSAYAGDRYAWSPAFNLSATNIAAPVAVFTEPADNIRYKVQVYNSAGCYDSAFINIKVYAVRPTIFIPTAFTPNNDGKNDILRPIAIGIQSIQYFQVYNRWGQLVFSTQINGQGWDGRINGQIQASSTFIWLVKAIDYTGAPYFKKGTVTLIR